MDLIVRSLGICDYANILEKMRAFTLNRDAQTPDECWILQHFPVFTQGQNGNDEHILNLHHIPLIRTDRGGQITYHGPGQIIFYPLLDLKRLKISVHGLVSLLEKIVITLLKFHEISAFADPKARGVYIQEKDASKKIASIGLRIKRGCSYHGIALNHELDLSPFSYIFPCGLKHITATSLKEQGIQVDAMSLHAKFISLLQDALRYTNIICNNSF